VPLTPEGHQPDPGVNIPDPDGALSYAAAVDMPQATREPNWLLWGLLFVVAYELLNE